MERATRREFLASVRDFAKRIFDADSGPRAGFLNGLREAFFGLTRESDMETGGAPRQMWAEVIYETQTTFKGSTTVPLPEGSEDASPEKLKELALTAAQEHQATVASSDVMQMEEVPKTTITVVRFYRDDGEGKPDTDHPIEVS